MFGDKLRVLVCVCAYVCSELAAASVYEAVRGRGLEKAPDHLFGFQMRFLPFILTILSSIFVLLYT